jgi:hypothetical protein
MVFHGGILQQLLPVLLVVIGARMVIQPPPPPRLIQAFVVKPASFPRRRGSCRGGTSSHDNNNNNNNNDGNAFIQWDHPDDGSLRSVLLMGNETVGREDGMGPSWSTNATATTATTATATNTTTNESAIASRGGGRLTKEKPDLLTSTTRYWKGVLDTTIRTLTNPFRIARQQLTVFFQSTATKEEEALLEQLRTMKVQRVLVPNSTVLPNDVVQIAAHRTGILGNPLRTEYVQDFAQSIRRWYMRNGYLLHSVTGATLQPETATVEIAVQEPVHHPIPVQISFYKEMIIDPDTGNMTTYRQYKEHRERRQSYGWSVVGEPILGKDQLNITYVPIPYGRIRSSKIARVLQMIPGQPFQWDYQKWEPIVQSGLFSRILQVTPRSSLVVVAAGLSTTSEDHHPTTTTTNPPHAVQLQIAAIEAPTKHLEYGVGKSLYSGGWEGELDFQHMNILGGGETLGIHVRRGTTESIPSIKCKFSTGRLGLSGGYDVEAFSEYIGDGCSSDTVVSTTSSSSSSSSSSRSRDPKSDRVAVTPHDHVSNPS